MNIPIEVMKSFLKEINLEYLKQVDDCRPRITIPDAMPESLATHARAINKLNEGVVRGLVPALVAEASEGIINAGNSSVDPELLAEVIGDRLSAFISSVDEKVDAAIRAMLYAGQALDNAGGDYWLIRAQTYDIIHKKAGDRGPRGEVWLPESWLAVDPLIIAAADQATELCFKKLLGGFDCL